MPDYFAYGSNLSEPRMRSRVGAWSARRSARLPGWRLTFDKRAGDGSGYATVERDPDGVVEGAVYAIDDEQLSTLDVYEGVAAGHYERQLLDGVGWVYVALRTERGLRPRRDYLAHLLAGRDALSAEYAAGLERLRVFEDPPELAQYFAFGSNLSAARMRARVGDWAARRPARLPGWRLTFDKRVGDGSGYATIERDPDGVVEGALYDLDPELFETLDVFEAVDRGMYERVQLPELDGAYTYVALVTEPGLRPRFDYLLHLLQGHGVLSAPYYSALKEQWLRPLRLTGEHLEWDDDDEGRDDEIATVTRGGMEFQARVAPDRLFVYGSLRPDDDSQMPWTQEFVGHATSVRSPARVHGATLLQDAYATAVLDGSDNSVKGAVLEPARLREADRIENYPTMYRRSEVDVRLEDGSEVRAWMYHRRREDVPGAEEVAEGDWLLRRRT